MAFRVLVRGGGDLASGVIMRLFRAGWQVLVVELERPAAVRRHVSFAQAVYSGEMAVEDVRAVRVFSLEMAEKAFRDGIVPVLVDPTLGCLRDFSPHVLVDGRMRKKAPEIGIGAASLIIGLGPGFTAGVDCHAIVETNRGPFLGRVIWSGSALPDTGVPERVGDYQAERVLRAPVAGTVEPDVEIGAILKSGEQIARVSGIPVLAPFDGVLRGMVAGGFQVRAGEKIGDVDPRGDPQLCWLVSDKALSVGGGVLEAILTWKPVHHALWGEHKEDEPGAWY